MSESYKKTIVLAAILMFTGLFFYNTTSDLPLIFEKDLRAHDESSNSVVAANVTRQFFPPKVRINPLEDKQGVWMEGPYWQHIPPLFAYVPYLFFKLDGQITIEVKRLSYAFLFLVFGGIFIWGVYLYRKKVSDLLAATAAAMLWINTPFSRALVSGYAFGVSDIVLACTLVLSFLGLLWYLSAEKAERIRYSGGKIIVVAILCALPIMAKNLLGAIPAATLFVALVYDHRTLSKKFWLAGVGFAGMLAVYYLPLYLASAETFKKEILVAFFHFSDLEGWGRPWHFYLTEYLPKAYLFRWTWLYFAGLAAAAVYSFKSSVDRKTKILLRLPLAWFFWNLIAVSLVESKIANFIFQTYILSLFAIALTIVELLRKIRISVSENILKTVCAVAVLAAVAASVFYGWSFRKAIGQQRGRPYTYDTEREKFYLAAEEMKTAGLNPSDLVVIRVSDNDCWFRYPILFLTGSEAKTLLEMNFNRELWNQIQAKYDRMFIVFGDKKLPNTSVSFGTYRFGEYNAFEFDLNNLSESQVSQALLDILNQHSADILADIERIKADKTSCQWLVPDPILNAD